MKVFNYKDTAKQIGWNFSKIKPYVEYKSDYNYYKKVVENITPNTTMLDIGCGSGEKSTRYFSLAKKIVMLDIENVMLKKAKANAKKYYGDNNKKFTFVLGDGDGKLNFKDESFDLVVSRHCGANMSEVYRVLKKGGVFISEDIDDLDCIELKDYFKRGQAYGNVDKLKSGIFADALKAGFSDINLKSFEEIEYYKQIEQLEYLLGYTPIIDGYDEEKDRVVLEKYCEDHLTNKGIKLNRRLFAFYIKK